MRPPRLLPALLLLAWACAVPTTVGADEESAEGEPAGVEATLQWEPGLLGPIQPMFIPFRPEPPEGLARLTDVGDARYARIRWGDGKGLSLGIDTAAGRERLWIDLDLDGELLDETNTTWFGKGKTSTRMESVRVAYEGGGGPDTVPVRFARAGVWGPDRVQITPWAHRRGEVVLGGRVRPIALVDGNSDLRFDDAERDRLYVDVDGDGRFATTAESHERIELGRPFRVGTEGWVAAVPAASGTRVVFQRTKSPPPPAPRRWRGAAVPKAGRTQAKPEEDFATLAKRVEEEREKTYAERTATIQKLGRLGTPEAFELLLGMAKRETNAAVAAAAARALGNPACREAGAPKVEKFLASGFLTSAVVSGLVQALHDMDHPGRERVYRMLLGSSEAGVVGAAARYLAYLATEKAHAEVLAEWSRRSQDTFRYQVYLALRYLPDGPPDDVMLEAAAAPYAPMAVRALQDLASLGHPESRTLALAAARREKLPDHQAKAVVEVLARIGDEETVGALLQLAGGASAAVETHVAQHLSPVRDPGAVAELVRALKAKVPRTRALAAQVLAGIAEETVTDALMDRVRRERDPLVLAAILEALGDHGDARSVALLLARAKKRKSEVRHAAIRALARVGLDHPKVHAFFAGLLAARRWEDRILALDAAAASDDRRLCGKVVPSLDHEKRQVRLAAAQALERLRCPGAIESLIRRLAKEEEVRVVDALARALFKITGLNLYDDARVWREWWEKEGKRFKVPATVGELPPRDAGGTQAGFYGIPVRSGRVVFVIDQSGSMSAEDPRPTTTGAPSGNRLDVAVREVLNAIKGLRNRDYVNVVLFHTTIHPWKDQLQRLTSSSRHELERHLQGQKPMGGTNLYDGLELALKDSEVDTIFLLSDGVPGMGRFVSKDDILRAVRRLNQTRRIAIHGISIGRDSDLLKQLADENGGLYAKR